MSGWDMKRFMKQLVMSAGVPPAGRLSRPKLLAKDPQNRLYARGPRFRLDAEQIRDNALFVSGLMNLKWAGRA